MKITEFVPGKKSPGAFSLLRVSQKQSIRILQELGRWLALGIGAPRRMTRRISMRRIVLRAPLILVLLFVCPELSAQWLQPGEADFTKAETKVLPVRGNITLIQIRTPQSVFNTVVLAGPDGYLLVDHPETAANPAIQKALDGLGKRPVKFLLNTHWHYDHVGGNTIYGPDSIIVAHENVRRRLMTKQTPYWSRKPIGPCPERCWPVITFRDVVTVHFAGEEIEMDHYANAHTDSDSVVYFARANAVDVGDLFWSKGNVAGGADIEGIARSLSAVLDRINADTVVITGHTEISNRRDLAQYVQLLNETIAFVRQEITAGKTQKEVAEAGLPKIWRPWFAPDAVPAEHEFMQGIYATLTHANDLNQ
jgi:glyoxylase-like metal-dependent hydrolase (beta-lactamase superfamily II)